MSSKKNPLYLLVKWVFLGVLMGVIGGLLGMVTEKKEAA